MKRYLKWDGVNKSVFLVRKVGNYSPPPYPSPPSLEKFLLNCKSLSAYAQGFKVLTTVSIVLFQSCVTLLC